MCYSAQMWQGYRDYVREFGADLSIGEFVQLYWERQTNASLRIPKAMDAAFAHPRTPEEQRIKALIDAYDAELTEKLEKEVFAQRKRLADAERALQVKETKAALNSRRVATNKVEAAMGRLKDLKRTEARDRDSRIYPGWYSPVMVMEGGRRVIKPMRYQCRLPGRPIEFDRTHSGCYNARRDNLRRFWKGQFGVSHGLVVVNAFYEKREPPPGRRTRARTGRRRGECRTGISSAATAGHAGRMPVGTLAG